MCDCIGVLTDAVALPCALILEEHCVTGYGHAWALGFFVRPRDFEDKSQRCPTGRFHEPLLWSLSKLAQTQSLLQDDITLFIADLQPNNRVGLIPVDQDRSEVRVKILKTDAVRIDLIHESGSRLGKITTRGVEAAAGHVE